MARYLPTVDTHSLVIIDFTLLIQGSGWNCSPSTDWSIMFWKHNSNQTATAVKACKASQTQQFSPSVRSPSRSYFEQSVSNDALKENYLIGNRHKGLYAERYGLMKSDTGAQ
ncbi:hypothetical protein AVEN_61441-1, partial [Araneus ventricosus]